MRSFITIWVFLAVFVAPAFSADGSGSKVPDDMARSLKQAVDCESYNFQSTLSGKKEPAIEGKYQKDQPIYFKADQVEFYKKGDKLIYKQGEQWQRTKTGVESDPLRILGPSAKVRETVPPHEELNGLEKDLEEVKAQPSQGYANAYTAHLTLNGCKKLLLPADQALAKAGRITFELDKDGKLVQYAFAIDIEGKRGNAEVKATVQKTIKLTNIGTTKVEPPDAARKALE
jgi:hypothetical protein